MKKIKQLLILVSFMLIGTGSVSALQNTGIYSDLTISDSGMFYNNVNGSSSQIGYDVIPAYGGTNYEYEYYVAYPTTNTSMVNGGYGVSLTQCDMSFVAGHYYSVSFYFNTDTISYVHPDYTTFTNKLAIGNNKFLSLPTFSYDVVSTGTQRQVSLYGGYDMAYTVIFKAPSSGTCLLTTYSANPTQVTGNMGYLGYKYEFLGSSAPTTTDIQNALSSQFDSINSSISSVNDNINELKDQQSTTNDKLDEANETSKGIWGSIKEGFSSIGNWFTSVINSINEHFLAVGEWFNNLTENLRQWFIDLFNDIKSLFVGEEITTCHTYTNIFKDYDYTYNRFGGTYASITSMQDSEGWYTFGGSTVDRYYLASAIPDLKPNTDYTFIIEFKELVSNSVNIYLNYPYSSNDNMQFNKVSSGTHAGLNLIDYQVLTTKDNPQDFEYSYWLQLKGGTNATTFRIMIIEGDIQNDTNFTYEYFTGTKDFCNSEGSTNGLFGIITNGINSIGNWFQELLDGILEGLKSLFIPEEGYFTDYFDELYNFFVEKLGILLFPIDLLLDVLDRFVNMNADTSGLIHIPSISIGKFGELIPEKDFYINEYWSQEPYSTIYEVYLIFVHAFIGFCLYKLASKKYKEIVGSGNSDS